MEKLISMDKHKTLLFDRLYRISLQVIPKLLPLKQ